jgi:hypothetical protein
MDLALNPESEANRRAIQDAFRAWQDGTASINDMFAEQMV